MKKYFEVMLNIFEISRWVRNTESWLICTNSFHHSSNRIFDQNNKTKPVPGFFRNPTEKAYKALKRL